MSDIIVDTILYILVSKIFLSLLYQVDKIGRQAGLVKPFTYSCRLKSKTGRGILVCCPLKASP